jgi:transposase
MSQRFESAIAVIGIDIGKNSFHVVGHDERGAIVLRQKWSRSQIEARFVGNPVARLMAARETRVGKDRKE